MNLDKFVKQDPIQKKLEKMEEESPSSVESKKKMDLAVYDGEYLQKLVKSRKGVLGLVPRRVEGVDNNQMLEGEERRLGEISVGVDYQNPMNKHKEQTSEAEAEAEALCEAKIEAETKECLREMVVKNKKVKGEEQISEEVEKGWNRLKEIREVNEYNKNIPSKFGRKIGESESGWIERIKEEGKVKEVEHISEGKEAISKALEIKRKMADLKESGEALLNKLDKAKRKIILLQDVKVEGEQINKVWFEELEKIFGRQKGVGDEQYEREPTEDFRLFCDSIFWDENSFRKVNGFSIRDLTNKWGTACFLDMVFKGDLASEKIFCREIKRWIDGLMEEIQLVMTNGNRELEKRFDFYKRLARFEYGDKLEENRKEE